MTADSPACDKSHMDGPQESRSGSVLQRGLGTSIYLIDRRELSKFSTVFSLLLVGGEVCGRIGPLSFLRDQMFQQLETRLKGGGG